MPANERSHVDQPVPTARHRRRRLLTHGIVFAGASLLATTLASSTTSAAPTVQDGRFLQGGTVDVTYSCTGADDATNALLTAFGLNPFPQAVTITSSAVEPAPSPGEDFDVDFTWNYTLDDAVVDFAVGLGTLSFAITNGVDPISATTGATGTSTGNGGSNTVILGDGSIPVGYTEGPFTGTFNRTAAIDSPIVFTPGAISTTVTTNGGTTLLIACTPGAGAITVLDETGVAPSTTTTTRPVATTPAPATTVAVAPGELPRTGTSSTLYLVLLALGLIDVGYLALTAGQPLKRRASSTR